MIATLRSFHSTALLGCLIVISGVSPASAQYLYLDSNGNGVHDVGDRLRICETRIDVWLDTAENRDGSPATCAFGVGALNLSHYEFVLQVVGGTVSWGPMSNLIPGFTRNLARNGQDSTGTHYHNGWAAVSVGSAVPPGLHHVATLSAKVGTGTPRIEIIARHPVNGTGRTSFGSECEATPAYDHTNRFGGNWVDADGLAQALVADSPPLVVAPGIVVPPDGTGVAFNATASDPNVDPIEALIADLSGLPPGNDATFTVTGLNTPVASGSFSWNPTASDSGDYEVSFTAVNCLGLVTRSTTIKVIGTTTGVEGETVTRAFLAPNVPNPFHPRTEIGYSLPDPGPVRIDIFTADGRRIRMLVDGYMSAGAHRVWWDGTDDAGRAVASGVYWYRLESPSFRMTRRMTMLR